MQPHSHSFALLLQPTKECTKHHRAWSVAVRSFNIHSGTLICHQLTNLMEHNPSRERNRKFEAVMEAKGSLLFSWHQSLFWTGWIQFTPSHHISFRSTLILFSQSTPKPSNWSSSYILGDKIDLSISFDKWVPSHDGMTCPQVAEGGSLRVYGISSHEQPIRGSPPA